MHELDQTFHLQQMTSFFSSHPFITIQELLDLRDVPNKERKFYYNTCKTYAQSPLCKSKLCSVFLTCSPPLLLSQVTVEGSSYEHRPLLRLSPCQPRVSVLQTERQHISTRTKDMLLLFLLLLL